MKQNERAKRNICDWITIGKYHARPRGARPRGADLGSLYFDEEDFLQEIVGLLQSCLGRPIAEIGSLDIP